METENKLKILFIEDVPSDKELAEMELRKEGVEFISEVVETKNDFIQALNVFKPDLIISDYSLPSFDGMQALTIAKEFYPTVPFILYTGSLNEETAVECIKAGAWDYVIKEHSARLPFAAKEAMEKKTKLKILKQSEEKYQTIFESTGTATLIVEEDTTITMANNECVSLTGYSSDELIGTKWTNYVAPESIALMMKYNEIRLTNPEMAPKKYEVKLVNKKGEIRDAILDIGFIKETKQRVVSMIDISERKVAEEELKELNQFSMQIVKCAQEGIIVYDKNLIYRVWNPYMEKLTGLPASKVIGKHPMEVFPFLKDVGVLDSLEKAVKGEINKALDFAYNFPDYEKVGWSSENTSPLLNSKDEIIGVISIVRDTTKAKKAEEDIKNSHKLLQKIIDLLPIRIFWKDTDLNYLGCNKIFAEDAGKESSQDMIGKDDFQMGWKEQAQLYRDDDMQVLKSGESKLNYEELQTTPDGEHIWLKTSKIVLTDLNGKSIGVLGTYEDITEQKKMINELIVTKNKAEEMSKVKSSFLANMSHEIRTPLNGILGFNDILKSEIINPEHIKYTNIIEKSGKRLLDTLHLILTFAKLDAEKQDMNYSNVKIQDVIEETIQSFEALAKAKNLYLKSVIKTENITTKSDEKFLLQILNNLMNNAIKYTNSGGVTVELAKINNKVSIKIIDTGIGIAKDKHEVIFEEFRQESEGFSRSFEGTGLGLSITKKFVELMKGKIYVESELGKGSTFTVELPFESLSHSTNIKLSDSQPIINNNGIVTKPKNNTSILIVEDDEENRLYIRNILKEYNTDYAIDAPGAIFRASEKVYDIILMDINLGKGMDGLSAVKEIRKIDGYTNIPIIAVTAYVLNGDKEEFLASGCTHYLGKPFERNQLLNLIETINEG